MTPQDLPNQDHPMQDRVQQAIAYFRQGYNCSQSVAMAFADLYGIEPETMARLAASFGGGIGRMRETCGAASGIFMLAGLEEASEKADKEVKARNYAVVQRLADDFRRETGSIVCRDLLKGYVKEVCTRPVPDERTDEYYRKRPCVRMVELAIRIYMNYLREKSAKE